MKKSILYIALFFSVITGTNATVFFPGKKMSVNFYNTGYSDLHLSRRLAIQEYGCPRWPAEKKIMVGRHGGSYSESIGISRCHIPEMFSARYYLEHSKAYIRIMCSFDMTGCDVQAWGFPVIKDKRLIVVNSYYDPVTAAFDINFSDRRAAGLGKK